MSWLDRAKVFLGILDEEDLEEEDYEPRAARRPKNRGDHPPLEGIAPPPLHSLDDALCAREQGDLTEMRRLLRDMDRGGGLRLVLRAAAALEANDEEELGTLLPKLQREKVAWRVALQTAAALEDDARAAKLVETAHRLGAPKWAEAWSCAHSIDRAVQRRGLVDLLFCDAALARTVAARELGLDGAREQTEAAQRFAGFAHGRDSIRRFDARLVADLLERIGLHDAAVDP